LDGKRGPFLIVDDEPEMCWALQRILQGSGGVCQAASDAGQAIAMAARQPFQVAFLDAKLPNDDGLDLARRLRESYPAIRIVIVSGYFYQDDPLIVGALQSGLISAFVAKPFSRTEILRVVGPSLHAPVGAPPTT
jgi:CheY-like chemotaxis protein